MPTEEVKLTVLGTCAGFPVPPRACSGYLLRTPSHALVLDLGYGAYPRLVSALDPSRVDTFVVTHAHPDHLVDVHAWYRAHHYSRWPSRPILLAAPRVLETLCAMDPDDAQGPQEEFEHHLLPGRYELGGWRVTSVETPHYLPNCAVRLDSDHPDVSIVYTGDTGPCPQLTALAHNADLLISEATDRGQQDPAYVEDGMLMTGTAAGRLAAEAHVRCLMLTHFWPGNDRERTREAAREWYNGPVLLADEGAVWVVGKDGVREV